MYIVLPAAVTNVMGAWVLAKRMRLLGEARALITIPDAIGARYRSRLAQGVSAIAILFGIVGYLATNALAMGVVINSIFGVGLGWGIWIGMGITLAYSASGGILAGIYNDVFQGTLMAVASVLVFLFVLQFGGGLPPLTSPDQATPTLLLDVTPIILAALVFSGVAAATMSAANSFINIGAAVVTHDLPIAFGRRVTNELRWGRIVTVVIAVAAAITAQRSGTMVAFLGIFGWGLFASTLVPALAVGLNWQGATRAGAMASIATGLIITLALETTAYLKVFTFPAGVTASAVAMVSSFLVFFIVSWLTRGNAPMELDPDVRLVMEV